MKAYEIFFSWNHIGAQVPWNLSLVSLSVMLWSFNFKILDSKDNIINRKLKNVGNRGASISQPLLNMFSELMEKYNPRNNIANAAIISVTSILFLYFLLIGNMRNEIGWKNAINKYKKLLDTGLKFKKPILKIWLIETRQPQIVNNIIKSFG